MVRAKFKVINISNIDGFTITLEPVYSSDPNSENAKFYKYTPGGRIELNTINETAGMYFEIGQEYYIDFIKAN